ncbi:MAG: hypothetical protein H0X30_26220, partial [Anaerolineae bacterium]|nr:hypothetical protein [Anaerolineae bacterium]
MIKKMVWLLAAMWLLLATVTAQAQTGGANWTVKLYEPTSGRLDTIDSSGQVIDTFTLPLVAGFDHYPGKVAVARNGTLLAYVAYNSTTYQGVLIVSQRDRLLASFSLPLTTATSVEFVADDSLFSDDYGHVALGYSLD